MYHVIAPSPGLRTEKARPLMLNMFCYPNTCQSGSVHHCRGNPIRWKALGIHHGETERTTLLHVIYSKPWSWTYFEQIMYIYIHVYHSSRENHSSGASQDFQPANTGGPGQLRSGLHPTCATCAGRHPLLVVQPQDFGKESHGIHGIFCPQKNGKFCFHHICNGFSTLTTLCSAKRPERPNPKLRFKKRRPIGVLRSQSSGHGRWRSGISGYVQYIE